MHSITLHDLPDAQGQAVGYTFEFAGSWNECPAEHFAQCVLARVAPKDHGGVRFQLLRLLAGIPARLMDRIKADRVTVLTDVPAEFGEFGEPLKPARREMRLLPWLDWVWAAPLLLDSKLPTIVHEGTTWTGPDYNLSHMSLDQWRWCVKLLKQFHDERDEAKREAHLDHLVGALYTPVVAPSPDASSRGGFATKRSIGRGLLRPEDGPRSDGHGWSSLPIEAHAERLKTLPLETRLAAAFNFEALNAVLPQQYKRTFGGDSGGTGSPQGILDISYDVAESGALGDYDAVNARLLHTVMGYMENNLYKDEREAARLEAMKE